MPPLWDRVTNIPFCDIILCRVIILAVTLFCAVTSSCSVTPHDVTSSLTMIQQFSTYDIWLPSSLSFTVCCTKSDDGNFPLAELIKSWHSLCVGALFRGICSGYPLWRGPSGLPWSQFFFSFPFPHASMTLPLMKLFWGCKGMSLLQFKAPSCLGLSTLYCL